MIIEQNLNKPKFTLLPRKINSYPSPGTTVMLKKHLFDSFVESVNYSMQDGDFLLSPVSLVRLNDNSSMSKEEAKKVPIVGPCRNESLVEYEFDLIFVVKNLRHEKKSIYVELESPFMNLPEDVKFEFKDTDLQCIEVYYGSFQPVTKTEDTIYFIDKDDNEVHFQPYRLLTESCHKWVTTSCVKLFSTIFDMDGSLSELLTEVEIEENSTDISSQKSRLKKLYAYDLREIDDEDNDMTFDDDEKLIDAVVDNSLLTELDIETHPLFQYTEEVMKEMEHFMRNELEINLDLEEMTDLFDVGFKTMLNTSLNIKLNRK